VSDLKTQKDVEDYVEKRYLAPWKVALAKMAGQVARMVIRLATDESLAGRVVLWWSDDEPKLIEWSDPGYREFSPFSAA